MRLLFTIPHYANPEGDRRHGSGRASLEKRAGALRAAVVALHQHFGEAQGMIDIAGRKVVPANRGARHEIRIVVHTTGDDHALDSLDLPGDLFEARHSGEQEPKELGFCAHVTLREGLGDYDYFCYLEDDIVIADPWFFAKLRWFTGMAGKGAVLQPNRFELGVRTRFHKVYVDGDLRPGVTAPFQDPEEKKSLEGRVLGRKVFFERPLNPHAGCFFLNPAQMEHWAGQDCFLDRDGSFVSPLESAAGLGIMKTFQVYKPARRSANFLEVEHRDRNFIRLVGGDAPSSKL
ncbi:MAG: calcium-binding protein [Verrucomicrobiales bacterium]